jgi:hypothetical protein
MTVDEGAYYVCSHGNICNDTRNKIYSPDYKGDKYECCAETFMNNINHQLCTMRCREWLEALHTYNKTNLKIEILKNKLRETNSEINELLYTISINNDFMNNNQENKSSHERYKIILECENKIIEINEKAKSYIKELYDTEYVKYPFLKDYLEKRIK